MIPEPQLSTLREVARQRTANGDYARTILRAAGYALEPGNERLKPTPVKAPKVPAKPTPEATEPKETGPPTPRAWVRFALACVIVPLDGAIALVVNGWTCARTWLVSRLVGDAPPTLDADALLRRDLRRASLILRFLAWMCVVAYLLRKK